MQVSGFGVAKLIDLFLFEDAGSAELMGDQRDLREMLDGLHLLEGFEQGAAIADCTVIGHEDSVVEGKEGDEAGRYLAGAGRGVGCEGNDTEGHHGFLTEHLLEAAARAGEGGGDGRMGVDDCANVVVPYSSSYYYETRPNIAIPKPTGQEGDGAVALDSDWALAP